MSPLTALAASPLARSLAVPAVPAVPPPPKTVELALETDLVVTAHDDLYSDRLRCDHPSPTADPVALGQALIEAAVERERGRVVVMAPARLADGLAEAGLRTEATIPGFYRGEEDCAVAGFWLDPARARSPSAVGEVLEIIEARRGEPPRARPPVVTTRATVEDAVEIAELIGETFAEYPTRSDDPEYVAQCIEGGAPFRLVRDGDEVVACASADPIASARTAELTDCATRPAARGRGLMQAILTDLMGDLREMDYPTAFTLARAQIVGVNLAFQRLGFELHGTMVQSCRIGDGLEDMNVWSRRLDRPLA